MAKIDQVSPEESEMPQLSLFNNNESSIKLKTPAKAQKKKFSLKRKLTKI